MQTNLKLVVPPQESPVKKEKRRGRRRQIYIGESIRAELKITDSIIMTEVISMSAGGLGVVAKPSEPVDLLLPGTLTRVVFKVGGHVDFENDAIVLNLSKFERLKSLWLRIGLSLVQPKAEYTHDLRRSERFPCLDLLRPLAFFEHPFFINDIIHLQVVEISANGIQCITSARNYSLIAGLNIRLTMFFPVLGSIRFNARITYINPSTEDSDRMSLGLEITSNYEEFSCYSSEYLVMAGAKTNPTYLKNQGFTVNHIAKAVSFDFMRDQLEMTKIAELRLKGQHKQGRYLETLNWQTMLDKYDNFSRQIVARVNGKIIAATRLVYNNGIHERSEHLGYGAEIPDWLWKEGFVESSRLVTDPDFRGADLFLTMTQHIGRVVLQSGYKYMLASCEDWLLPIYLKSGCQKIGTFVCEPSPTNWNLLIMDVEGCAKARSVGPITWNLVHSPVTEHLVNRQIMTLNFLERLRTGFFKCFKPIATLALKYKMQNRNKTGQHKK